MQLYTCRYIDVVYTTIKSVNDMQLYKMLIKENFGIEIKLHTVLLYIRTYAIFTIKDFTF